MSTRHHRQSKKRNIPKWGKLLVVLVVVALLGSTWSSVALAAKVSIRFLTYGYPEYYAWLDNMKKTFEEKNPNVDVQFEYVSTEDMRRKVMVDIAGGDPPHVSALDAPDIFDFAEMEYLEPVDNWISAEEKDKYYSASLDFLTIDGKLWALPSGFWIDSVIVREDLLKEKAFQPADIKTWNQWLQAMEALVVDKDGDGVADQYALSFGGKSDFEVWYRWVGVQYGNNFYPNELEKKKQWIEFIQFVKDAFQYSPPASIGWTGVDGYQSLANEVTTMHLGGTWAYSIIQGDQPEWMSSPGVISAVPNPLGPSGKEYWNFSGSHNYVMYKRDHQKEAWEFLLHITQPEQVALWAYNMGISGRKDVSVEEMISAAVRWLGPEHATGKWWKDLYIPFAEFLKPNTMVPHQAEYYDAYAFSLVQAALGKLTAEEAYAEFYRKARPLLEE